MPILWLHISCLLYTSDAADERSSVDLGGRRIIKKKKKSKQIVSIRITTYEQLHLHEDHIAIRMH